MESQGVSDDSQVLSVKLIERERKRERDIRRDSAHRMLLGSKAAESVGPGSVEINKQIKR